MILSFVLFGMFSLCLLCYAIPSISWIGSPPYRCSVSKIVCVWREFGGFVLSLANIIMFLIVIKADPVWAWIGWVSAQGVACFFVDTSMLVHLVFLAVFMFSMLYVALQVCIADASLIPHSVPLWIFSTLFALAIFANNVMHAHSRTVQTIFELLWMLSLVYFYSIFELTL